MPPEEQDVAADAAAFGRLFEQTYLRFHRRDGKRSALSGASRAVLLHLALSGPLTVGEAARHLDRAQSVVSDIVSQLEAKGLLERQTDVRDRRRTLVWLTPEGVERLDRDRDVLGRDLLEGAMAAMTGQERRTLLHALRTLLAADQGTPGADQGTPGTDQGTSPSGKETS